MSFLFPLYLLGALAIALPVLLHLRKRPPKDKIAFGSLMFLEKSTEQLTRRTRIEHWVLLALRCLALLALALVFCRPFLRSATLPSELPDTSIGIVLVDRSASMQREDLAKQAVFAAEKAIKSFKMKDEVSVMFFDRETRTIASFEDWKLIDGSARAGDFKKRNRESPNGWDISNPGTALVEAADLITVQAADKEYLRQSIVLISDFKEGSNFDALNQFAWPEDITVECIQISPKEVGNFSLTLAATSAESRSAAELVHRVRIANAGDSESDRFELSWKGNPDSKISGVVPPGSSRVLKVFASDDTSHTGELVLSGDSHPYDNTVYVAPSSPLPLSILYVSDSDEPDSVGSPYFYLKRAFHPTASLAPSLEAASFTEFSEKVEEAAAVVIQGNWTTEMAGKVSEVAESGKLVIALPNADTTPEALGKLLGVPGIKLEESADEDYAMLASLDFEHPILAPFARAQIRDFTKIRFWKHRKLVFPEGGLPDGVTVLAEFDTKTPAWITRRVGDGFVFVFLSGWEPRESQFALSSKFVPVLYSIFENAGYSAKSVPTYYVGEIDVLNGKTMETATKPGLFSKTLQNGAEIQVGVNLHPSEGRVDPIDPNHTLSEFNITLKSDLSAKLKEGPNDSKTRKRIETEEKEASQKLWKWLVIAVLLFLIAETWLSGRRGRVNSPVTA